MDLMANYDLKIRLFTHFFENIIKMTQFCVENYVDFTDSK